MSQGEVEQAEELMRKARYPEAIERFRALLSVDPENPLVRARCGEAYRLSGNNERAFHHYNKAAAIFTRNNDASNALRMLQFANAVSSNEPEVLFRMAECMKVLNAGHDMEQVLVQIVQVAKGTGDRRRLWALDELWLRHPDDMEICLRRAEALAEAGRIDDAVSAWKKVSAWLDQRGVDFVPMLQRAAAIAPDRSDVGVDLAAVLLANRRPREALILLVPYYEKFPDDVAVLETLLRALEGLGATDKIIPARIELIKARAKRGMREPAMREIAILLQTAPEDIAALEVCAHACTAFNETNQAIAVWRRLAHLCDRLSKKFERDRAILMLLKANPDDEDALTLGARALREAGRTEEAVVLENRLAMIRKLRARNAMPGKKRSSSSSKSKRHNTNPFGSDDNRHAKQRPGSGATVLLDEEDALATMGEKKAPDPFAEEPTVPPDDMLSPLSLHEPSEPSIEAMPIARNPYVDNLVLDGDTKHAPMEATRGLMPPPSSRSSPRASQPGVTGVTKSTPGMLKPPAPSKSNPGPSKSNPGVTKSSPDLKKPVFGFNRTPGSGSKSNPGLIEEFRGLHEQPRDPNSDTTKPGGAEVSELSLDAPTRPYPAQTPALDVWSEGSHEDVIPDDNGLSALFDDESLEVDVDVDVEENVDVYLPIESPSAPEETTSRIAQLVSDELMELRAHYADPTIRAATPDNVPIRDALPTPDEFDAESIRPTQRLQKLTDLFGDLRPAKKA